MANLLDIPLARLAPETLAGLLEEFASRDGTDYGDRELSLAEKVVQLRRQLDSGDMRLLYDGDSETWDLVSRDAALALLAGEALD
ncbi:MAG: YheU family protein [Haliea sp.]|uniref:YheU family protein n=1 Tax=Haliea sp. TaxID=1932666 RepID=UPI0032ED18A8